MASATLLVETYRDADFSRSYTNGDVALSDRSIEAVFTSPSPVVVLDAVTDEAGVATFNNVPSGSVSIRQVLPAGWVASDSEMVATSLQSSGTYRVRMTSNDRGRIAGAVYGDQDNNGYRTAGDAPLIGQTVYLDDNDSGQLDAGEMSMVTDAAGYHFDVLASASRIVRVALPPGYRAMDGASSDRSGRADTSVALAVQRNIDFGITTAPVPGRLNMTVFVDTNGNGVKDANEQTTLGRIARYQDLNENGVRDPNEPKLGDFATGFFPVLPGSYPVRIDLPSGVVATTPLTRTVDVASDQTASAAFGVQPTTLATPKITGTDLTFGQTSARLSLHVDQYVWNNFNAGTIQIKTAAGVAINQSLITTTYDDATNTLNLDFPAGQLADGNYQVVVSAADLQNLAGVGIATPYTFAFHLLAGDLNHDRVVNFDDLVILAQHYGQTGRTFSEGNIDYSADGAVNFDDLVVLAQRYNKTLAAPAGLMAASTATEKKKPSRHTMPVI